MGEFFGENFYEGFKEKNIKKFIIYKIKITNETENFRIFVLDCQTLKEKFLFFPEK